MSSERLNYCVRHDEQYALACLSCSGEWFGSLSRIEQALVVRASQPGVPYIGCKKFIEDFRKMEVTV